MKKTILSISLLSCGTEPHIEDCLKGLMPLREQLGAQIVVVDTSSEKSGAVRDILNTYADKVVDFDWCDDFAAARNAGLAYCIGEWFMFIDDDEVFDDVSEIISFFESGEHRRYKTASFIIRNLGDEEGNDIYDTWIPRIYRRSERSRFEGRVHERFVPAEYPLKALHTIAKHYGYIFKTYDEFLAHSERNLRLIRMELQVHPDDLPTRIQLLQEHVRKRDFDGQREVAEDCLNRMTGRRDQQSVIYRSLCHGLLLRADRIEKQTDEGIKRLETLEKTAGYSLVAQAFFSQEGARLYDDAGNLKASLREAENYLRIYDDIKDELDRHSDELAFFLASTFDDENLGDMRGIINGVRPPERLGLKVLVSVDEEDTIFQVPFPTWMEHTDSFMDTSSAGDIAARYQRLKAGQRHEDIRYDYFYMRTDEKMLMAWVRVYDGVLPEKLTDIEYAHDLFWDRLEGFCKKTPAFFEKYKGRLTEEQKNEMAPRLALSQGISLILSVDRSDAGTILHIIRENLGIYPAFDPVLTYFAHLYGEYIKQGGGQKSASQLSESEMTEMGEIIQALQQKVDELVSAGMIEEADAVLKEIQKFKLP